MDEQQIFWALYARQVLAIIGSLFIVYLGYRLFSQGVYGNSDVEIATQNVEVVLRRMAPGGLLMVAGVVIFALAVFQPAQYEATGES